MTELNLVLIGTGTAWDITLSSSRKGIQLSVAIKPKTNAPSAIMSSVQAVNESQPVSSVLLVPPHLAASSGISTIVRSSVEITHEAQYVPDQQAHPDQTCPSVVTTTTATASSEATASFDVPQPVSTSVRPRGEMSPLRLPDESILYPLGPAVITGSSKSRETGASPAKPVGKRGGSRPVPDANPPGSSSAAMQASEAPTVVDRSPKNSRKRPEDKISCEEVLHPLQKRSVRRRRE
ncbi:hypothetical protein BCV69DRAFT_281897 [Microstroma glucosiphilum]|uniref:Uncharacterized protein n=1 Tax=Pseudomicrostroma glucosiphilum TaxID=1684307 RepID=A0A316UA01_9BASI|nr:hypothetical protein BCV69DRAFT_281897 [Pseudomicrostroma glucosiphilum]PWN21989.1 hypothetical protein BCV69DRAFT_281897 [Pseudomicrostroma glucosiphilum]